MADDQGWGDVGYNGNEKLKTPTLDEMAAKNLRFDRFYAAAPVCSPTRGSVLTGRHPNRFGCFSWGYEIRPEEETVAEALRDAGYATGHFGKWHLGSMRADNPTSPGQNGFDPWFSSPNFSDNSPLMSKNGKVVQTDAESSQVAVDAALEFIESATAKQQPFLAVIWFGSPHLPHQALDADRELYPNEKPALQNYWGEITAMDRAIGNLRKELRRLKIADNTVLWYTSDNGATTPGSTGGLAGKKGGLQEGGIRVPAIIEWPAVIKQPRRSDLPCGSVDIFPTVLELAGAKAKSGHPLDGESLVPLIEGKQVTSRTKPLGFWVYPAPGRSVRSHDLLAAQAKEQAGEVVKPSATNPGIKGKKAAGVAQELDTENAGAERPGAAAWIDGNFKLHRLGGKGDAGRYQLYDLVADPTESTDIAAQHPEVVVRMKAQLAEWQASVAKSLNRGDYATKAAE
jgi:arylsulfatase A-like enzyme